MRVGQGGGSQDPCSDMTTMYYSQVQFRSYANAYMGFCRGAKIAGQREWGWVSQQLGIPTFPQDFPDCQAAVDLAQLLAADQVCSSCSLLLVLPIDMAVI